MGTRDKTTLGQPKNYREERTGERTRHNRSPLPFLWNDFEEIRRDGGWVGFTPPGEQTEIQLFVPPDGDPHEAMREWFFRREASRRRTPRKFDVRRLLPAWNYGSHTPRAEVDGDGFLRLEVMWSPPWDHMKRAQAVWNENGGRGPHPVNVLATLDPEHQITFPPGVHPKRRPARSRFLSVSIDLLRPLDDQFKEAKRLCRLAQDYLHMLSGRSKQRPGRQELGRDVLIYTLRESARWKIREIARDVFPREDTERAQGKVKQILRYVRTAVSEGENKHDA